MEIVLEIEGKEKLFTASIKPMLARRKYLELEAKAEERKGPATAKDLLREETEMASILANVVFKGQFTVDELLVGCEFETVVAKLNEAVFGIKEVEEVEELEEKN